MTNAYNIVLASQSPRRKQLMEWAEVNFDVIAPVTDEAFPETMPVEEVPVHIARNKALAVKDGYDYNRYDIQSPIVAADTIVVLNNQIIGKPESRNDAIRILSSLSGKRHQVITGVVILAGEKEVSFADITSVWFHELTEEQIIFYVDKYEPYDKAGAYAIQEWIGVTGIKSIEGDFYNVMGLPVSRVLQALQTL
ncbi:Maf family protein [Pseudobacter ginsenosidimutans]|uniref:dTTP/UTP pyrophosphatase n=1 Tax=Pseudobacter ginsenosidimutans TaxID=661488 RepID=A0A4Q7N3U5_9BACT|nr:Maf family protein [Pseudobacter ginsenosidimutans]QEC44195.1 septum formation protein Maf [Pseudobacter ginsenosidimutans]RZS75651.1 septum formation protein [Pseudobacter ginsenosidimutans]